MLREMWEEGRATLDRLASAARQLGLVGVLGFASAIHADIDWRIGNWTHARADAAVDIEQNAARQPGRAFFGHAVLARVEAGLGLYESAGHAGEAALVQSRRIGMQMLEIWARSALGFLAVTRGDFESAVEQLELVWRTLEAGSVGDPGVLWWQGDLAEAYIALGRRSDAARLHQYLAAQARATDRGWGLGVEARIRGLIEEDERRGGRSVSGVGSALRRPRRALRGRAFALARRGGPRRARPGAGGGRARTRDRDLRRARCRPLVGTRAASAGATQCVGEYARPQSRGS